MAIINKQDTDGSKGNLAVGEFGLDIRTGNEKVYVGLTGVDTGEALAFEDEMINYIDNADNSKADKSNVLELDNTSTYIPSSDYNPATKKYVDDNTYTYTDTDVEALFNVIGTTRPPLFANRAWLVFNGQGTTSIIESENISSLTDLSGTADYSVSFITSMPDSNYVISGTAKKNDNQITSSDNEAMGIAPSNVVDSGFYVSAFATNNGGSYDPYRVSIAVVR